MLHGRSSSDYCERRSGVSELRFWGLSTVSEYPLLVIRHLLNTFLPQDNKAILGKFNDFVHHNKLLLRLTER